jgi:hypothetical protein
LVKIRIRDPGSGINISDPQHCFLHVILFEVCPIIKDFVFADGHEAAFRALRRTKDLRP